MNIIAVDWGKGTTKRAAYLAETRTRTIGRLSFDGSLQNLIDRASGMAPPVLIAIDAVIGFPASAWKRLIDESRCPLGTFVDCLHGGVLADNFFVPVATPEEWSPKRPFIRPPAGSWSRTAFEEAAQGGFWRRVDKRLKANPMFVTSGIPGTVGSGTAALWQEIVALTASYDFRIWPFHGSLDALLGTGKPVIAEIYPKACYGIALAHVLPAALRSIGKTKEAQRQSAILELLAAGWINDRGIKLSGVGAALSNDDDFDALLSAAALMRLVLENAAFERPDIDPIAEGGVLGEASVDTLIRHSAKVPHRQTPTSASHHQPKTRRSGSANRVFRKSANQRTYNCPIPGCSHVFQNSRGGWDAHVASYSRHSNWHPTVRDPKARKQLFKKQFPDWFKD